LPFKAMVPITMAIIILMGLSSKRIILGYQLALEYIKPKIDHI
jgi:hypothetical protein